MSDRAAAQRQHLGLAGSEQLQGDFLLDLAERRLAVLGEYALDRLAEPLLDRDVDVNVGGAERLRGAPGGGRLAGAHEPDADDLSVSGRARLG